MSPRPKVLVAATATYPVIDPFLLGYGGVPRAAFYYMCALNDAGFDVLPVATADSNLPFDFPTDTLWAERALCVADRSPAVYREDMPEYLDSFGDHLAAVAKRYDPDVLLLLGPRNQLMSSLVGRAPQLLDRTIVSLRNGPGHGSTETAEIMAMYAGGVHLVALTEAHRASYANYPHHIEVIREGIPVKDFEFSDDPRRARGASRSGLIRNPDRMLVSQIDYIGSPKGQLLALHMFERAGLHLRGFDFLIGGDYGAARPGRNSAGSYENYARYEAALRAFIAEKKLSEHVYFVGGLSGAQVADVYRCSDFTFAPHRMAHGELWDAPPETAEAYGRAMAIALASGTPVLASDKVDVGRMSQGVTGFVFHDLLSGVDATMQLASACERGVDRKAIRRFAETHDSIEGTLDGYIRLCQTIAQRTSVQRTSVQRTSVQRTSVQRTTRASA